MSDSAAPWTATCQAPLSVGFLRQEYWTFSRGFPGSGIKPASPAVAGRFLTVEPPWKSKKFCWGKEQKRGGIGARGNAGSNKDFILLPLRWISHAQKNSVIKESLTYPFSRPVIFKLF